MAELETRTLRRVIAKGHRSGTEGFAECWEKFRPDPRGIPPSVVEAEIASPGSTSIKVLLNESGEVITAYPRG